jgi:hypothetical protein
MKERDFVFTRYAVKEMREPVVKTLTAKQGWGLAALK